MFIKVTRLYSSKNTRGTAVVKKQQFHMAVDSIESFRPASTPLEGQKTTIRTKSGQSVSVTETHTEIAGMIATAKAGGVVGTAAAPAAARADGRPATGRRWS